MKKIGDEVINMEKDHGIRFTDEMYATKDDVSGLQSDIDLMNLGTIVCIGDSYLEGYNPTDTVQGWGDHLATLLGKTVAFN